MIDSPRRLGLPGLVAVPGVLLLALVLGLGRGPEIPGGSVLRGSFFPAWLDRAGEASPEHATSGAELERLLDRIPAPRFLVLDLDRLEESSLTRAAGIDELVGVALSGDGGGGRARRTLEALASLPRLAAIDLSECHGISDPDLDPLAWMRGLRSLTVGGFGRRTPVGDSTLARLAGSRVLQELSLVGCEVSATGLRAIGGMERLESLDLSDAEGASDLDYAELASLRRLEWLRLARISRSSTSRAVRAWTPAGSPRGPPGSASSAREPGAAPRERRRARRGSPLPSVSCSPWGSLWLRRPGSWGGPWRGCRPTRPRSPPSWAATGSPRQWWVWSRPVASPGATPTARSPGADASPSDPRPCSGSDPSPRSWWPWPWPGRFPNGAWTWTLPWAGYSPTCGSPIPGPTWRR